MLSSLDDNARVWIFPASRSLNDEESEKAKAALGAFLQSWAAHGEALSAESDVLFNRFLVIGADEAQVKASGCSIDSLLRQARSILAELGAELLDNSHVFYLDGKAVQAIPRAEFKAVVEEGNISNSTPVFDNSMTELGKIRTAGWPRAYVESWHAAAFGPTPNE